MKFTYCPHCGTKTTLKEIGDEGMIPYCETCNIPLFPMFSTCVLSVVMNELHEAALIQQSYGTPRFVGVAGYRREQSAAGFLCTWEIAGGRGI